MSSDLPSLYKNYPINVWVKDAPTKNFLAALWNTAHIGLLIGGGHGVLDAVLEDAQRTYPDTSKNIFYIRDLDRNTFRQESYIALNSNKLKLPCHEIENLLLDADAIMITPSINTRKYNPNHIDELIKNNAEHLIPLFAAQDVIDQTNIYNFHPPKPSIETFRQLNTIQIRSWIVAQIGATRTQGGCIWDINAAEQLKSSLTTDVIGARFDQALEARRASLRDGSWRLSYPGKEILIETIRCCQLQTTQTEVAKQDLAKIVGRAHAHLTPTPLNPATTITTIEDCHRAMITLRDRLLSRLA
jgi:hypothetical protein